MLLLRLRSAALPQLPYLLATSPRADRRHPPVHRRPGHRHRELREVDFRLPPLPTRRHSPRVGIEEQGVNFELGTAVERLSHHAGGVDVVLARGEGEVRSHEIPRDPARSHEIPRDRLGWPGIARDGSRRLELSSLSRFPRGRSRFRASLTTHTRKHTRKHARASTDRRTQTDNDTVHRESRPRLTPPAVLQSGAPQSETFDGVVVCAGVRSRDFAAQLGDRPVNLGRTSADVGGISTRCDSRRPSQRLPRQGLLDHRQHEGRGEPARGAVGLAAGRQGKDRHVAARERPRRRGDAARLREVDARSAASRSDRFRIAGTAEFNGYNYDIRQES